MDATHTAGGVAGTALSVRSIAKNVERVIHGRHRTAGRLFLNSISAAALLPPGQKTIRPEP